MGSDYIAILIIIFVLLWLGSSREYEIAKARTVRCDEVNKMGHAMGSSECFDYAKAHKDENYLVQIREREFHVSFSNQTVAEIGYSGEARSYSCQVFDVDNWICPYGFHPNDFHPDDWVSDSSRIVMKDGEFEEWLNWAVYPNKDIHLKERTTHYVGNWMEFKVLQICRFFGCGCKPSYNIDVESKSWY